MKSADFDEWPQPRNHVTRPAALEDQNLAQGTRMGNRAGCKHQFLVSKRPEQTLFRMRKFRRQYRSPLYQVVDALKESLFNKVSY